MKKQNTSPLAEASPKFNVNPVNFQFDLPMLEMILQTKAEIEALSAQAGLKIIRHFLEKRQQAAWRLRGARAKSTPEEALKELRACVKWLDTINPSAARSLEEGLAETLTITRLGLHESLVRTFRSTNLIESCFARTESWTGRVKRWRAARRVLRWGAAALRFAEKGFRRIKGCEHLHQLIQALQSHNCDLAPMKKAA